MILLNANKLLNELSQIEDFIKKLEELATKEDLNIDFDLILENSFKNYQ